MRMNRTALEQLYHRLPNGLKSLTKRFWAKHWAHPALKKFGTVQDLYYWTADGELDTLLLLPNYFSALYPALNTETSGTVSVYSQDGESLGVRPFSVGHQGCAKFRVSSLLHEFKAVNGHSYGTLEVHLAIPVDVLSHIKDGSPLYYWDRFDIGYINGWGQTCFVHGVDKTHIYRNGRSKPLNWYATPKNGEWAPEIPVNIEDYQRLSVIMLNRTSSPTTTTLTLSDTNDRSLSWTKDIPPKGVRRFQLNPEATADLAPVELRMRIAGMATQFGRPVVFKEFPNGSISAMHC